MRHRVVVSVSHDVCRNNGYCTHHYQGQDVIDCGGKGLPDFDDLVELVKSLQRNIDDDDRADEDSDVPGVRLTVGYSDDDGSWSYQTGDNSFTGGAYGHPHWAVVEIGRDDDPEEVADDIQRQIAELMWQ